MKVKELIEILSERDPEQIVVVDVCIPTVIKVSFDGRVTQRFIGEVDAVNGNCWTFLVSDHAVL